MPVIIVMPKVTQEYINQKKNLIVQSAAICCDKKAVCSVTMQDVIDESGLSQGGIYRFYQNSDDILVDVLKWVSSIPIYDKNKVINNFIEKISPLRNTDKKTKQNRNARRKCIYEFICSICSELSVLLEKYQHPYFSIHLGFYDMILNYPERAGYIFSRVDNPFSMKEERKKFIHEIEKEIQDDVISPSVSIEELVEFLRVNFLGINQTTLVDEKFRTDVRNEKIKAANFQKKISIVKDSCCFLLGLKEFLEDK